MDNIPKTTISLEYELFSAQDLGASVLKLEAVTLHKVGAESPTFHGVMKASEEPERWARVFTERDEGAARGLAERLDASLRPFTSCPRDDGDDDQQRRRKLLAVARCLQERPKWTLAHVAAYCGLHQALSHAEVCRTIDEPESDNGRTPLMMAVEAKQVACARGLLGLGARPEVADKQGNMAAHYMASQVDDDVAMLIYDLAEGGVEWLGARNGAGSTPLHVAARAGALSAMIALLANGANFDARDGAHGDTPLHVAIKRIVQSMRDSCSSSGVGEGEHVQNLCTVVKALVLFRADLTVENKDGHSVWDLAADVHAGGVKDQVLSLLRHGEAYARASAPTPVSGLNDPSAAADEDGKKSVTGGSGEGGGAAPVLGGGGRVLCMDGGGIRGLVLARILDFLWRKNNQRNLAELFDWVAGTSTGGILAIGIGLGFQPPKIIETYFQLKDKVFRGAKPHSTIKLKEAMKFIFKNVNLGSITHPRVMVTSTKVDILPVDLMLFTNYKHPDAETCGDSPGLPDPIYRRMSDLLAWQAATWTCSAPFLFSPIYDLVDGGLLANNPTMTMLAEVYHHSRGLKSKEPGLDKPSLKVVLSLGTGKKPTVEVGPPFPTCLGELFFPSMLVKVFNCVMSVMTITEAHQLKAAKGWCHSINVPFFRKNPEFEDLVKIDETDNTKLLQLIKEVDDYILSDLDNMSHIAKLLSPSDVTTGFAA
ncbi:intracellular phospholipase A2-like [Lampetra planeri]